MSVENSQETVVNDGAPVTTTEVEQEQVVTPPTVENTATTEVSEDKSVPYTRFQEVIQKKNAHEQKIKELEDRLNQLQPAEKQAQTALDRQVAKLVSRGMDENVARLIAETSSEIAQEQVSERLAPMERASVEKEMESWIDNFSKQHTDYKDLEPEMQKIFTNLPESTKSIVVSDKMGLELLYSHAKRQKLEQELGKKFQEGVSKAYDNKGLKAAVSSTPVTAKMPDNTLTRESISKMGEEEYTRRKSEIVSAMFSGQIK